MQEIVDRFNGPDRGSEIARTLLLPYLNHAATMLASEYATRDDIDAAMRFGCGYPIGPLALIDALGADVVVSGLEKLHAETGDPLHKPAPALGDLAGAGASDAAAEPQLRHEIDTVGVVGTGTMAAGIAEVFAKAGHDVVFVGRSEEKVDGVIAPITKNLDKAIAKGKLDEDGKEAVLARLTGATSREALADVDIVVEAIAEDMDVKLELFTDLDRIAKPGAILATTTSSLSISELAACHRPARGRRGHPLLQPGAGHEAGRGRVRPDHEPEVAETAKALSTAVGKHPVSCTDRAGFIVNALLFPYLNDAVKLHEAGDDSLEDIDTAMKETQLPMGPFELLDVVGNDVSLAIQQSLVGTFGHAGWEPAPTLVRLVEEGKLGRKTGEGFHSYR